MGNSLRLSGIAVVLAFGLVACAADDGAGGTNGTGATGGTAATGGAGGVAGTGGTGAVAGAGGTGGMGGDARACEPGGGSDICTNNNDCMDDDCVCCDCDTDLFCSDPENCVNDGECRTFQEGCVCADCMNHPDCLN